MINNRNNDHKHNNKNKFAYLSYLFKPISILSGLKRMGKIVGFVYGIQENLTQAIPLNEEQKAHFNTNNIIQLNMEQKKQALAYSQRMLDRSKHALIYLGFVLLWLILNIVFMRTQLSWWLVLLQVYLCGIFIYYFLMCCYQADNTRAYAHEKPRTNFKNWLLLRLKKYIKK